MQCHFCMIDDERLRNICRITKNCITYLIFSLETVANVIQHLVNTGVRRAIAHK